MPETKPTPTHLLPERCYVCGGTEAQHPKPGTPSESHVFWSNADAGAYFAAEDRMQRRHMTADDTPEARYVAQHRPY